MTQPPFSTIGQRFTASSGILELMDDLGRAMTDQPHMLMLGGGNPAAVPEMQQRFRQRIAELLSAGDPLDRMLGNYDPPQGNPAFLEALADLLSRTYGWEIGPRNIAVTNGCQTAFFYLFNLLGGTAADGTKRQILLPMSPEYIGYANQGLADDLFVSCRPEIVWPEGLGSPIFKYRIDFKAVEHELQTKCIGAIAVSRPTNPSGNVLTDDEVLRLSQLAENYQVPLILDGAYGTPFPGIVFVPATPFWKPHAILTLSLSKLGLPGTRTGIVVASEAIITAIGNMTAITGLANGTVGQQIVLPWIRSGEILNFGPEILSPYYQRKSEQATAWTQAAFQNTPVDWAMHASEGALFHWLWLRNLKITSQELYQQLKSQGVLVVPGEYFFFGLQEEWPHRHQCLRVNYSQPQAVVQQGLQIIAETASRYCT